MRTQTCVLALLLAMNLGCGSSSSFNSTRNVSGAYDFAVTSNVTGAVTLIEANFSGSGNQSSGKGPSQVQILTLEKKIWYVNGVCPGSHPGQNSVAASTSGGQVTLAFNEGGNAFGGQGVFTGSTINGNYSINNSKCPDLIGIIGFPPGYDQGGFVGNQVPALTGTFSGPLNLPSGTDNAALSFAEKSDHSLIVTAKLTGPADNGTFAFNGTAIGNSMFVSGSVNNQDLSLLGYYDQQGTFTGFPGSFLVFNYVTQAKIGVLLAP